MQETRGPKTTVLSISEQYIVQIVLTYYQKQVPLGPFPSTFEPLFSPISCKSRHLLWQFYTCLNGLHLLIGRLHDLD